MNTSTTLQIFRIATWDVAILTIIYFLPTISHLLSFPLYLIDPMRISVLGGFLFLRNEKNAYILAVTLPLFSYLVSGHPVFLKSFLILIELVFNVFFLQYLFFKFQSIFWVVLSSIALSKIIYYIAKYFVISLGILDVELIATSITVQIGVAIFIASVFVFVKKKFSV